jgi:subtilisin family serine protease
MKNRTRLVVLLLTLTGVLLSIAIPVAGAQNGKIGINVVLNTSITDAILSDLGKYGQVKDVFYQINALRLHASASNLSTIRGLSYVAAANPDAERTVGPIDTVTASDFTNGLSTWDQDSINVTNFGQGRVTPYTGAGVYVAVLDTGLLRTWRQYFPQERIATQYAKAFGGGGNAGNHVSEQPNKWESDQDSHGTHVTSSILGYSLLGTPINGAAPMATVIPVKVLNQNGSGWSSVIARGITYIADLKAGPLAGSPVVINMSLGGPELDAMEKAAIDYAISRGVIVVASAGNSGDAGMGYPGAYAPVISVAASGWVGQWLPGPTTWWLRDVADPTVPSDFYIAAFSSRQLAGQDLDVAAPGSWVVGPYQVNGQISYFYLSGTSMASPHVAGIVALMLQKNPSLTAAQVEAILTSTAIPLGAGCRNIIPQPGLPSQQICWPANAAGSGLTTANAALTGTP